MVIFVKVIFCVMFVGVVVLIWVIFSVWIGNVVLEGRFVRWRSSWGCIGVVFLSVGFVISCCRRVLVLLIWRMVFVYVFFRRI